MAKQVTFFSPFFSVEGTMVPYDLGKQSIHHKEGNMHCRFALLAIGGTTIASIVELLYVFLWGEELHGDPPSCASNKECLRGKATLHVCRSQAGQNTITDNSTFKPLYLKLSSLLDCMVS